MRPEASTSTSGSAPPYNAYASLPRSIRSGQTPGENDNEHILELLGVPPAAQRSKVTGKHLSLENPARQSDQRRKAKTSRAAEKKKKARAAIRGHAVRGLLPKEGRKRRASDLTWEAVRPLHRLWLGYMSELLGLQLYGALSTDEAAAGETGSEVVAIRSKGDAESARLQGFSAAQIGTYHAKLVKADFLGSIMSISRAANPSLVGLQGIVVQETENTLTVVTQKDAVKVLPKVGTIFTFSLPLDAARSLAFDLSGTQFAHRAAERVGRKFKARQQGDFAPWDVLGGAFEGRTVALA